MILDKKDASPRAFKMISARILHLLRCILYFLWHRIKVMLHETIRKDNF